MDNHFLIGKERKTILIIIGLLFISFSLVIGKVSGVNELYALDPWQHMYFTKFMEPIDFYGRTLPIGDSSLSTHYPSFMRSFLYIFHLITNVDYFEIYKYFGFITRLILGLLFFSILGRITGDRIIKIGGFLVFLGGYYFWYRGYITFTENFILIIQSAMLYLGILFLQSKNPINLYLQSFLLAVGFYYHPPSSIISIILYLLTIILYLTSVTKNRWKSMLSDIFIATLFAILISAFSLGTLIIEIKNQITYNVGTSDTFGEALRYISPNIQDYVGYQSVFLIIFGILGFIIFFQRGFFKKTEYILLVGMLIITFILTNGIRFGLSLPTDRMQGFFMIYLGIFSSIGLFIYKKVGKTSLVCLFSFLILYLPLSISGYGPFFPVFTNLNEAMVRSEWKPWLGKINITEFLNNAAESGKNIHVEGTSIYYLNIAYPKSILLNKESLKTGDLVVTEKEYTRLNKLAVFNSLNVFEYSKSE